MLKPVEVKQTKICFATLIVALLLKQANANEGVQANLPAVDHCTVLIDEIIGSHEMAKRSEIVAKINETRVRLTRMTRKIDVNDGLIGALRLYTSGFIVSKPGTRLDYILGNFRENLPKFEEMVDFNEAAVTAFVRQFKKAVNSIA